VSPSEKIFVIIVAAIAAVLLAAGLASPLADASTDNEVYVPDDGSDTGDDLVGDDAGGGDGDDGLGDQPDQGDDGSDDEPTGNALTFARTIYGETALGNEAQAQGVACVVMNRYHDPWHYPLERTVGLVCTQPKQFSCWDVQALVTRMMAATTDDANFAMCANVAQQALSGTLADVTGGAEFYHDNRLAAAPSAWGNVVQTVQIGTLTFYKRGSLL
jgi:hypothetical protein